MKQGSYVNLSEARFGHNGLDRFIFKILADYGVKSVKLTRKQLDAFKKAGINLKLISPKLVHEILKNQDISLKYDRDNLINLLKFFVDDDDYSHLDGMYLLPLANNEFVKFGDYEIYYYMGTEEQRKLLPSVEDRLFIHDVCNSDTILKDIFDSEEFQNRYNIRKFDGNALSRLLGFELIPNRSIRNWDPTSQDIPNKNWLDRIWKIILNSITNLSFFEQYPILDVCYPRAELTLLNSRAPVLEFPADNDERELVDILCKFGHKFTNRQILKENNYIIKWTPGKVIKLIDEARINRNRIFSRLSSNEIDTIRSYVKKNWENFCDGTYMYRYVKPESRDILQRLPIWPTFPRKNEFKSPPEGTLFPENIYFLRNHAM